MSVRNPLRVGIVGSTGLVGEELLAVLAERRFPVSTLELYASERSVGKRLAFGDASIAVRATEVERLRELDVLFLSAGASVSRTIRPQLAGASVRVFDNTSAFRMDSETPLVVPEVDPSALRGDARWFAVPNCTAILLTLALAPLEREFGLEWVSVATYQAISGAGREERDRLLEDLGRDHTRQLPTAAAAIAAPTLAFNVVPSIGTAGGGVGSSTGEEEKVTAETRRILGREDLPISVSCVRVPVLRAHSEVVEVCLRQPVAVEVVREALARAPGVTLREGVRPEEVPTPRAAAGGDGILVGRVRPGCGDARVLFFLVGDQLRKGAALNAVQMAEMAFGL